MPFIFRTTKVVNYEVVLRWSADSGIVDGLRKSGTAMGKDEFIIAALNTSPRAWKRRRVLCMDEQM